MTCGQRQVGVFGALAAKYQGVRAAAVRRAGSKSAERTERIVQGVRVNVLG